MLTPVDLEVETPLQQGATGIAVVPVHQTAPKVSVNIAEVVDDVAGNFTIGSFGVWIKDFAVEPAQAKKISQWRQTLRSCVDRLCWVGLGLAFTGVGAVVKQDGGMRELKSS